jgi:hypothetical protein
MFHLIQAALSSQYEGFSAIKGLLPDYFFLETV